MYSDEIVKRIATLYPDAVIEASGQNCDFEVYVVSEIFHGQSAIQRQQPILALFAKELANGRLHALSIKARTPEELSVRSGLVQIL